MMRAAVIVNPAKADEPHLRERVSDTLIAAGWSTPLWLETTPEDPGHGVARTAVEAGAQLVIVCGGDGTVMACLGALAGTNVALALIPLGTGNLLARNLGVPTDFTEALSVAVDGVDRRIDLGRVADQPFAVMAGIGFDAAIMADAPERLKKTVGPLAYALSGVKNLRGPQFRIRMKIDQDLEFSRRARSVVIGNCGKLTGGLVLMPEAEVDDGWLDAIILSPTGVVSWVAVAGRVISRKRKGHERVDHHRLRSMTIRCDRPEEVQVDGDTIGQARALSVTVDPLALVVRVG